MAMGSNEGVCCASNVKIVLCLLKKYLIHGLLTLYNNQHGFVVSGGQTS